MTPPAMPTCSGGAEATAAEVAAGIANKGVVMKPFLVQSVIGSDLSVIESADPTELSEAVTPEVAATLTDMMVGVVQEGSGSLRTERGTEHALGRGDTVVVPHGAGEAELSGDVTVIRCRPPLPPRAG